MGKAADSFNPDAYLVPPPDNHRICIAPRKKGGHCEGQSDEGEYREACRLRSTLHNAAPEHRRSIIEKMILLQVCDNGHRKKLHAEEHCLRQLVSRMEEVIFPDHFAPCEDNNGRDLRDTMPLFAPYSDSCRLYECLTKQIPSDQSRFGHLYSFSWPLTAEHKKIGWAKHDADIRVNKWKKCHPAASIQCRLSCRYPERMEKLIHVQLTDKRHQLLFCGHCGITHIEWFRITQEEMLKTLRTWELIMEESEIYDSNGKLCDYWLEKIDGCRTAKAIMDRMTSALDEELLSRTEHLLVQTSAALKDESDGAQSSTPQEVIAELEALGI